MSLSICIPTYKRPEMLSYTLSKILESEHLRDCEIVIADNERACPFGAVEGMLMSYDDKLDIRYMRQKRETLPYVGIMNAIQHATGEYVTFMADDDWIRPNILEYVKQMEDRPELMAIVSDLVAWDDEEEKELHRYWKLDRPYDFGPDNPLGLVEFVCNNLIYPEICVYRRSAILRCMNLIARGHLPFHLWMYHLSRLGVVRFETEAYYQENRIVKKHLQRTPTTNLTMRMGYIGDEFRNVLEGMVLLALQDSRQPVNDQTMYALRKLIERFLHGRLALEIGRAIQDQDFILAIDLARRLYLWTGQKAVDADVTMFAANQHWREMFLNGSDGAMNLEKPTEQQWADLLEVYRL